MILDELYESPQTCPKCGGPSFSDLVLAEKKDACYSKVRSRYKVWPSAYASGALVQCRKKGAANWGNKSKNESAQGVAEGQVIPGKFVNKRQQAADRAAAEKARLDQEWAEYNKLDIEHGEKLKRLAAWWWNNDESPAIEKKLDRMGLEIGRDEGYDEGGVFIVAAGDENGDTYMSWPAEELENIREGVAEGSTKGVLWRVHEPRGQGGHAQRYYVVKGYDKDMQMWKNKIGAGDFANKEDAEAKARELNQDVTEGRDDLELYGLRVGDTVKAVINDKRVQGDVIDIFPETQQVELLLRGANAGRIVVVDVQDTQALSEQGADAADKKSQSRSDPDWTKKLPKEKLDALAGKKHFKTQPKKKGALSLATLRAAAKDAKPVNQDVAEGIFGNMFGGTAKAAPGQLKTYAVYDGFTIYYDPAKDMLVTAGTGEYKDKFRARGFPSLDGVDRAISYGENMTGGPKQAISINRGVLPTEAHESVAEGGDVFAPGIENTPAYKAGFATGKLPVPHPEGTQEYAAYYKGVIDRTTPTLNKGVAEGLDDDDEGELCHMCAGTGEGRHESETCDHCHGTGYEPTEDHDWYADWSPEENVRDRYDEANEPDADAEQYREGRDDQKIAGRYDPDDFDDMVNRLRQRAEKQEKERGPVDLAKLALRLRDIEHKQDRK